MSPLSSSTPTHIHRDNDPESGTLGGALSRSYAERSFGLNSGFHGLLLGAQIPSISSAGPWPGLLSFYFIDIISIASVVLI